jgi:hypothetical protein
MRNASVSNHTNRHIKNVKEKKQRKVHPARLLLRAAVHQKVHRVEGLQVGLLPEEDHHQGGVHREANNDSANPLINL